MPVNGPALAATGVGVILVWSALHNQSILTATQDLVSGKKPPAGPLPTVGNISTNSYESEINAATGNVGAATGTAAQNQAIAKILAAPFGWSTGAQWDALVQLWDDESGWSNTAENASGAYGIAQALPNTKYPLAGRPPSEGGSASATVQIAWGLTYILTTYGDPVNALAHENEDDWY
jgi:hypothetical protein